MSADTIEIISGTSGLVPSQILDNGTPATVECYDYLDDVAIGQTWYANADTLQQAVITGRFAGLPNADYDYQIIGALASLMYTSPADANAIQMDQWDVTDPGAFPLTSLMEAYDLEAKALIPTLNYADVMYFEPVGDVGQALVEYSPDGFNLVDDTPEPGTWWMAGAGLVLLIERRRRRAS
jgi:MYXO-CTERM domain-containing protein